jgi:hypothetical protein
VTPRRRRAGLIVFLGVTALLATALVIARWYFSGPRLARFLVSTLFSNIRGRVEIDTVDWPFMGITGRNLPATVKGLRIYAPDQKTLVLSVEEATAVIDWPTVVFGRHDVLLDNVIVHEGYALVRQYDVADPPPGGKPYEVGFVAALQSQRRPGDPPPAPGNPGPIIEIRGLSLRDTEVHLEFPNWNAHVYGISGRGVLRQSFRNPRALVPDFTYMLEAHVERGSVEFAKQHFELADIV